MPKHIISSLCSIIIVVGGVFFAISQTYAAQTVSGTLYSDQGTTAVTSGSKSIKLRIGTSTPGFYSTTTLSGTGFFQFPNLPAFWAGLPLSLYVDGDASLRAFAFTKASSTLNDVINFDLYQNRIIVKHEGAGATTTSNAELGLYDGDDDSDIQFTANGNNFVSSAGQKLLVAYGTHYTPGGTITLHSSSTATSPSGDFQLETRNGTSSILTLGGTLSISGSYNASSTSILNINGNGIFFTATSTGKVISGELIGNSSFGALTFSGSGGAWSFLDAASTTGNVTIAAGAVTAPTLWTVNGNYTNYGTFTHNNGTLYLSSSTAQVLSGSFGTSSPFYNLVIDGAGVKSVAAKFITATHTSETYIWSMVVDSVNGVLYAGSGYEGVIFRCLLSTGCDSSTDFTIAYNTPTGLVSSFIIDTANSVLYIGTGSTGIIYRCLLSTNCDASGDFTTAYDTPQANIMSLAFDSANAVLYAGTDTNGVLYRCLVSTLCDAAGDFTVATDTDQYSINALVVDQANGVLYMGTIFTGILYRCILSTGCDSSTDFTIAYDALDPYFYSLAIDAVNGVLYAGTADYGIIYRCLLSTSCDAAGDFTVAYDTPEAQIYALTIDTVNGVLYAGTGSTGRNLYRCVLSSGCDGAADFTMTLLPNPGDIIRSLAVDSTNGMLYIGMWVSTDGANIYRCPLATTCDVFTNRIMANDILVTSGATLMSQSDLELFVSGNYTNSGTSSASSTAGFYFTGSSAQSLSGTLTGTSSLPGINFSGAGTKTFAANASTSADMIINSGATVVAPNLLTVGSGFTQDGTFTHNGGTLYLSGLGGFASGTMTGASALNNVVVNGGGAEVFKEFYMPYIASFAIDSAHGALFVGSTDYDEGFYRCLLSTGCDQESEFVGFYFPYPAYDIIGLNAMAIDQANGVLYVGANDIGFGGIILRCVTATLCDEDTDFTIATDTPESAIKSLVIDATNGVLYAGSEDGGIIYRCVLSTGCDSAGDFTTAYDTSESYIISLAIDAVNGVLYAGTGFNGIIYRCLLSTSCDAAGDFTLAYDTPGVYVNSLVIDTTNAVLYAATYQGGGVLYRCILSTNCDASGDFTVANPVATTNLAFDSVNGILYSSEYANSYGKLYRCFVTTGCDSSSDFTTDYRIKSGGTNFTELIVDQTSGSLFAGAYYDFFTRVGGPIFSTSASTSNLTINTGKSLIAPASELSVAGNYTNSGNFIHNSGVVYLNGTSPQTATGTMTGASSWNNLTILNNSGTDAQTNPSIIFGSTSSTTGTFTAVVASTSIRFPSGATTSMVNLTLTGGSAVAPIFFRSSSSGIPAGLSVSGSISGSYLNIKDSNACSGYGNITVTNSFDATGNTCWIFAQAPSIELLHYRWREDNGTEVAATYSTGEDTVLTASDRVYLGDRKRLRILISNAGAGPATNITYRAEYASSSCTYWLPVPSNGQQSSEEWIMDLSQYIPDGAVTTNGSGLTDPGGSAFVSGQARLYTNQTSVHTLAVSQFTEHEFSFRSTVYAVPNITYCFRLTNAGSLTDFVFTVQPQIVITSSSRPQSGGTGVDANGSGAVRSSTGVGGGSNSEGSGSGAVHSGGGAGGGGGDSG